MSGSNARKRGGTFHLDRDLDDNEASEENDVQFVTPYYDEGNMPEPLDLSKLCLDDEPENTSTDEDVEEERFTRGRSRSRSVHENDIAAPGYLPQPDAIGSGDNNEQNGNGSSTNDKGAKKNGVNSGSTSSSAEEKPARRGGPLQQREVQALKKVREEECYNFVAPNFFAQSFSYILLFLNGS